MTYTRHKFPFDEHDDTIKTLKRDLDHDAKSRYPAVARVLDAHGQVLSETRYEYVHDRKLVYTELVSDDWTAPVTVRFVDAHDAVVGEVTLEKVTCSEAETQLEVEWPKEA